MTALSRIVILCAVLLGLASAGAGAAEPGANRQKVEQQFQQWLVSDLWPEAKAAGISRGTFDAAFRGISLDWSMPELVPPGTSGGAQRVDGQAEFGSPAAYFDEGRISALAAAGRLELAKWGPTLTAIEKRYGVSRGIVVAVWARESGYGLARLPYPAVRALATEAFMGKRKERFRGELIAALKILEAGDVPLSNMKSSWAGALGQPQLLPSQFQLYAVDFDGDGHRNIWSSVPDTLASIANSLKEQGWNGERGWGVEARVPPAVACTLEGPEQGKPMSEWARLGVVQASGEALPVRGDRKGFLLMPAGRFGPAFIVTENFYTLKEYNYSDLYALYIGHLADRLRQGGAFSARWGKIGSFTRADVLAMQVKLQAKGYDVGNADGLIGFKTRIAVGLWQAKQGLPPTCFPDAKLVKTIG